MKYSGPSGIGLMVVQALDLQRRYNILPKQPCPLHLHIRPEMWGSNIWEDNIGEIQRNRPYVFPPPDLMSQLVNLYFQELNIYLPVLHRPTFERSIQSQLHFRDNGFASALLLVCAIGARWSSDKRACVYGGSCKKESRGWAWFNDVQEQRIAYTSFPGLYDLQFFAV